MGKFVRDSDLDLVAETHNLPDVLRRSCLLQHERRHIGSGDRESIPGQVSGSDSYSVCDRSVRQSWGTKNRPCKIGLRHLPFAVSMIDGDITKDRIRHNLHYKASVVKNEGRRDMKKAFDPSRAQGIHQSPSKISSLMGWTNNERTEGRKHHVAPADSFRHLPSIEKIPFDHA